jgi:hypothetical protein
MTADKFEFIEDTHTYLLNGKKVTGVTTILGVIAKPALIQWAANKAVDYVNKAYFENKDTFVDRLSDILDNAKKAHITVRDDAAKKGTNVHSIVEEWINQCIDHYDGKAIAPMEEHPNKQFVKFYTWAVENQVVFLASEVPVYSKKHYYAGTYDFMFKMDGKKYMGDLKTSNGIYGREYFAQCAAYRLAHEEMTGEKDIDGSMVVRCGKNGTFEAVASYDYETDKDIFLAALKLYRGLATYK